jgi:hypothetical protein
VAVAADRVRASRAPAVLELVALAVLARSLPLAAAKVPAESLRLAAAKVRAEFLRLAAARTRARSPCTLLQ